MDGIPENGPPHRPFPRRSAAGPLRWSGAPAHVEDAQLDAQPARDPVATGPGELVLQVVAWSSAAPGSGVPAAARVHSSFVSSRLPASAHACAARCQVAWLGSTPATDTAYTPGLGGFDPGGGVQSPSGGNSAG
jgi:hypothetical protein